MWVKHDACYKPIEIKNHGYKQYSFVKYGLDILRNIMSSLPIKNKEFSNAVILFAMAGFENSLERFLENSA
jgi:hypothetical protein